MRLPLRARRGTVPRLTVLALAAAVAASVTAAGAPRTVQHTGVVAATLDRSGHTIDLPNRELAEPEVDPPVVLVAKAPPKPVAAAVLAVHTSRPAPVRAPIRAAAPRPAPAPSYPAGTIEAIIVAAAEAHGVSPQWMLKIAACESGYNPRAYNPAGPYYGLFQFLMSTFEANGGTNIWDPYQQANITATMLAHGQAHQWGCA